MIPLWHKLSKMLHASSKFDFIFFNYLYLLSNLHLQIIEIFSSQSIWPVGYILLLDPSTAGGVGGL